ncbi:peptidase M16 [Acinetobacter sp. NCu2D-2]|uniref:M16 family metallopeptidase n=1 Tax=Acinetobacter sp. NCu2D-2 TaxID=1608473 RepID=UPI0007CDDCDA|nr:pitrilysin family protein [Acinetobacter sp. NCu2D-2]ANF81843.1 peptidase M16 [Acinetobacter sp. NCu2D-2]
MGLCIVVGLNTALYAKSIETTSKITEHSLENGLKIIIREDHRSPMVMSHIWYKVGSADEPQHLLGISHVLEHMMFKGTNKVPNNEFTRLSRIYGGTINAATSYNYTNYYQLYPKAYFPMALELEADRMQNLQLRQQDFEPELKVVMEERRQRTDDKPNAKAFERFKWLSFPTSAYRNPIIGQMSTLENITLKDLKDWYESWYQPNNAVLVIVGDVDTQQAIQEVQKYFAHIPAKTLPQRASVQEIEHFGYRHFELYSNVQIPHLYLAWNTKSIATAQHVNDAYILNIIRSLLDSGINSRLHESLIRKEQILTSVSVSYDAYNRGDSLMTITALPTTQTTLQLAQRSILEQIEKLKKEPVSKQELERVKNRFISNLVYNQDNIVTQAKTLGNLAVNNLDPNLMQQMSQYYENITPQDIMRVANQYLIQENLSSMHLLPESLPSIRP